ncbi:MAG: iron-containing alcohol dehydrogenase [Lachnospiraceae bacterium]|nr:iron-containing alcohol dehydrogenase [Lachnospiraceae bacterium]
MKQVLYDERGSFNKIAQIKKITGFNKAFIICGKAYESSSLPLYFENNNIEVVLYTDRTTKPTAEDVEEAYKAYTYNDCDILFTVGGGSITDLGKMLAMRLTNTAHVAVPTVAATGCEANKYAIVYENEEPKVVKTKRPEYVILNGSLPGSVDEYNLKCGMVYAVATSLVMLLNEGSGRTVKRYASAALKSFFAYGDKFVKGGVKGTQALRTSFYAGKALQWLYKTDKSCYDMILSAIKKADTCDENYGHILAKDVLKYLEENHKDSEYLPLYRGLLQDYGLAETTLREQIEWNIFTKEYVYTTGKRIELIKGILKKRERAYINERVEEGTRQLLISLLALHEKGNDVSEAFFKEVREYIINLKGYVLKREVGTINFKNALEKSDLNTSDKKDVIALYNEVKDLFEKEGEKELTPFTRIFGAETAYTNLLTLEGAMIEMGYLLSEEDYHHKKNRDDKIKKLFYWRRAVSFHEDKKHNEYLAMLHKAQLDMMDEIDRVCTENNLTYFLNYGSLLGAIRHKGYIPWDDDLDICMPREDYDRFREVCKEHMREPYYVYNNIDFDNCTFSMMKVMSRDTIFVRHDYRFGEEDGKRMFIDIWPLDNVPGPIPEVEKVKKLKSKYTGALRLKVRARCGENLKWDQKLMVASYAPFSEKYLVKKREETITKWKDEETDYWLSGGVYNYLKETHPKEWYLPPVRLPYEDRSYLFPNNYDALLKHFYGNYMKLPPLNKRFTHAPFEVQFGKDGEKMYFPPTAKRGGNGPSLKKKTKKFIKENFGTAGRQVINSGIKAKGLVMKNPEMKHLKGEGADKKAIAIFRPELIDEKMAKEIREERKNGTVVFANVKIADYLRDMDIIPDYLLADKTKKSIHIPEHILEENDTRLICIKNRNLKSNIPDRDVIRLNYIYYPEGDMENEELSSFYKKNHGDGFEDFTRNIIHYMGFSDVEEI